MKLTPEQQQQNIEALKALMRREPIERQCRNGAWMDCLDITADYPHRPKPKEKTQSDGASLKPAPTEDEMRKAFDGHNYEHFVDNTEAAWLAFQKGVRFARGEAE